VHLSCASWTYRGEGKMVVAVQDVSCSVLDLSIFFASHANDDVLRWQPCGAFPYKG
jgi:hypothetical protein